ncbi:MAG: universal stress protein, partial [Acidimicrobiales bacterium]|nr:universal stress protein [Acidimicrobiales bacterium]
MGRRLRHRPASASRRAPRGVGAGHDPPRHPFPPERWEMSIDTILLGMDGSPASLRAATWAASRAAELEAEVVVVHALDPDTQFWRDITP